MQITIKYTSKIENYYEAEKYFRKKKKMYKIDKISEILVIIFGIYMIFMKNYILGGIFIIFGIIFFTGKDIKSEMKWDFYKGFMETPNTILLLYNEGKHYAVLPKESFTENSLEEFRELLKQKFD